MGARHGFGPWEDRRAHDCAARRLCGSRHRSRAPRRHCGQRRFRQDLFRNSKPRARAGKVGASIEITCDNERPICVMGRKRSCHPQSVGAKGSWRHISAMRADRTAFCLAVLQGLAEPVVGIGLVRKPTASPIDRNDARLCAVQCQMRETSERAVGFALHRDGRPKECAGTWLAEHPAGRDPQPYAIACAAPRDHAVVGRTFPWRFAALIALFAAKPPVASTTPCRAKTRCGECPSGVAMTPVTPPSASWISSAAGQLRNNGIPRSKTVAASRATSALPSTSRVPRP